MCLAIEEIKKESEVRGEAKGEAKGIFKILHTLVEKGLLSIEDAAENAGVSVEEFQRSKP